MSRSEPTGPVIWAALRRRCPPDRDADAVRVDLLAGDVGVSEGALRQYLRVWDAVDLVSWPSSRDGRTGRHLVRLLSERPTAPVMTRDCGGKYIYLGWPGDDEYWTVDYCRCSHPHSVNAEPVVTRHSRRADWSGGADGDEPEDPPAAEAGPAPPSTALAVPDAADALPEPASWDPQPEVLAAAARIVSLYETAVALAAAIEAQVMEALHEIRRHAPDDEAFMVVVSELTPLRGPEALRMAQTWDVARRQRDLRSLAETRPREAMSLIGAFVDAGAGEAEMRALTSDDVAVAEIIALPPRKRVARLRTLVASQPEAGHHPADREQIRTLTTERDALAEEVEALRAQADATRITDTPRARLRAFADGLARIEGEMEDAAVAGSLDVEAAAWRSDPAIAARIARTTDAIAELAGQIGARALEAQPEAGA